MQSMLDFDIVCNNLRRNDVCRECIRTSALRFDQRWVVTCVAGRSGLLSP